MVLRRENVNPNDYVVVTIWLFNFGLNIKVSCE